tara:strand:+ start:832 stop:972 length:141 start_codon:yes stop_codon:yes gene_type:complete
MDISEDHFISRQFGTIFIADGCPNRATRFRLLRQRVGHKQEAKFYG